MTFGAGMTAHREDPRIAAAIAKAYEFVPPAGELGTIMAVEILAAADAADPRVAQLAEARQALIAVQRYAEALAVSNDVLIEDVPGDLLRLAALVGSEQQQ